MVHFLPYPGWLSHIGYVIWSFLCEQGRVVISVLGHFASENLHPTYVTGIPGLYGCHWKEVAMVQGITAGLEKGLGFLLVSNMETYLKSLTLCQDC